MSKIIKPLLNEDGTQVKRPIVVGEYYHSLLCDDYLQWKTKETTVSYLIYYAEDWKPKENEMYYYFNFLHNFVGTNYYCSFTSDQIYIEIGNCFRTREEAEQADIQTILDNLKTYYKKKNKEAGK
jgi:hypothetical protein